MMISFRYVAAIVWCVIGFYTNHHAASFTMPPASRHSSTMSVQQRGQHNVLYSSSDNSLVEGDWSMIAQIESESSNEEELQSALLANLSNFHPRVIMFLRQEVESPSTDWGEDVSVTAEQVQRVGGALVHVLEDRMEGGRQVLKELLESGELRKLDGAIGHAARAGKLDMAFFTVLNANLQDAVSTEVKGEDASRLQILQHIYTRCQEEVEKTVAPGIGLLNKLLRTEVSSIRSNQLEHYLGPQPPTTTIITPDGKSVELKNSSSDPLVALNDFVQAMADSVKQIRTVEKAGGTDRATAAGLVESIRQLAMEARFVIAQVYAVDSDELKQFEDDLQPIFRPDSAESEYAKGE